MEAQGKEDDEVIIMDQKFAPRIILRQETCLFLVKGEGFNIQIIFKNNRLWSWRLFAASKAVDMFCFINLSCKSGALQDALRPISRCNTLQENLLKQVHLYHLCSLRIYIIYI